jgi:hypothetical protein
MREFRNGSRLPLVRLPWHTFRRREEVTHGDFQTSTSGSSHPLSLVLGVGVSRMCCGARVCVARRICARTGRCGRLAHRVAASQSAFGVRHLERRWRSSGVCRLGAARRAGDDLLAERDGKWMRPAPESLAVAACRGRIVRWWHGRPCPTGPEIDRDDSKDGIELPDEGLLARHWPVRERATSVPGHGGKKFAWPLAAGSPRGRR